MANAATHVKQSRMQHGILEQSECYAVVLLTVCFTLAYLDPYLARLLMLAAALLVVPAVLAPFMADYRVSTLFGVSAFLHSGIVSLSPVPVQLIAPPGMQAQLIAFVGLVYGSAGGLGPVFVGLLSERLPHGRQALARAIAVVAAVSIPVATSLFFGVWRALRGIGDTKIREELSKATI